jgi:hypothetical protein
MVESHSAVLGAEASSATSALLAVCWAIDDVGELIFTYTKMIVRTESD